MTIYKNYLIKIINSFIYELLDYNMEDLEDFLDFMDIAEDAHRKIPKRYIRDYPNPFEFFYETEFKKRFKFSKEVIMYYILPIIEGNLTKDNNRGLPVPPVLQLLMALRFYATGNYQVNKISIKTNIN